MEQRLSFPKLTEQNMNIFWLVLAHFNCYENAHVRIAFCCTRVITPTTTHN